MRRFVVFLLSLLLVLCLLPTLSVAAAGEAEPGETAEGESVPGKTKVLGDANLSGKVDLGDACAILYEYWELSTGGQSTFDEQQFANSDINTDYVVNAADANVIAKYLVELDSSTELGEKYTESNFVEEDADVDFSFVDDNGESTVYVNSGNSATVSVIVAIDSGDNKVSALDLQFACSEGLTITKIDNLPDNDDAFQGNHIRAINPAKLRAVTYSGEDPMVPHKGKAVFRLTVEVSNTLAVGKYEVGLSSDCRAYKDGTSEIYSTSVTPLTIEVEGYNVQFLNEDGTGLQNSSYAYGEKPVYTGGTPTKAPTEKYEFEFTGWNPEIDIVTKDTQYMAVYSQKLREYNVTFNANNGTDAVSKKVIFGNTVDKPEDPKKSGYAFDGWFADEKLSTPFDFATEITKETKIYAGWTQITYTVTGDTEWTQGSGTDPVFTVKRNIADDTCIDHFKGVSIDGTALEKDKDYTVVKGSTVVTLKAATLDKLAAGEHSVSIGFDDGEIGAKLSVKAAPTQEDPIQENPTQDPVEQPKDEPASPKTGDSSRNILWCALLMISAFGTAVCVRSRKREQA